MFCRQRDRRGLVSLHGMWHSLRLRLVVGLAAGSPWSGFLPTARTPISALHSRNGRTSSPPTWTSWPARSPRGPRRWRGTSRNDRRAGSGPSSPSVPVRSRCARWGIAAAASSSRARWPRTRLPSHRSLLEHRRGPVVGAPRSLARSRRMPPPRRPRERLIALTQPTGAPVSAYGDARRNTRLRERLQTNGAAIVVATVFALLCALLLFDDPGRAPTLTIDNPTAFDVRVEVSDANRAEWTVLTSARQQCGATVEAPIDHGGTWVFRLQTQGLAAEEIAWTAPISSGRTGTSSSPPPSPNSGRRPAFRIRPGRAVEPWVTRSRDRRHNGRQVDPRENRDRCPTPWTRPAILRSASPRDPVRSPSSREARDDVVADGDADVHRAPATARFEVASHRRSRSMTVRCPEGASVDGRLRARARFASRAGWARCGRRR